MTFWKNLFGRPDDSSPSQRLQVGPHESRQRALRLRALLKELERLTGPSDMPRAIAVSEEMLALLDQEELPELWASLQYNLGNHLAQNPWGDQAQNLEEAIRHYERALEVYTRDAFPEEWATVQNNLAGAYSRRIRGERAQNLE